MQATDSNGAVETQTFTIKVSNTNDAPSVANNIPDTSISEDSVFSYQIPSNTFADIDVGDTLTYSAELSNGSALPSWLSFDASTRTLSGTPPNAAVGTMSVKIIASDGNASVSDTFVITINNVNDVPTDIVLSSTSIDEQRLPL